jgi:hypothetical protein
VGLLAGRPAMSDAVRPSQLMSGLSRDSSGRAKMSVGTAASH